MGADPTLVARIAATEPSNRGAVLCAPVKEVPINAKVQTQHQAAQDQLDSSGESGGVQQGEHVVLDE